MRYIPYGMINFKSIRNENYFYVDKTMYLEKLESPEQNKSVIFLRPRRFGKSLFTSMMNYYYAIDTADDYESLFKGLYIYDHPTPNKNNYYILKFDFSGMDISGDNVVEEGKERFTFKVKNSIEEFVGRYKLNIEVNGNTASELLMNMLKSFKELSLNNKIYVIIDEYDNFTNNILHDDAKDFLDLVNRNGYVRSFYEIIKEFSGIGVIDRFFATGVLPLTLDNLTNGFNIATNISANSTFSSMIGFTHEEVKSIVNEVVPEEKRDEVYKDLETNYDGYRFSTQNEERVFNSTLVMYYLADYCRTGRAPENIIDPNMNVSGEKLLRYANLINPDENKKILNQIVYENEVGGKIESVVLDNKFTTNDFITLLFYLGYITIKDVGGEVKFKIPNYVSSVIYSNYFVEMLNLEGKYDIGIDKIQKAITELADDGKLTKMTGIIKDFLVTSSNRNTENFSEKDLKFLYMVFMRLSTQYNIYDEYQAGQGFVDLYAQNITDLNLYEAVIELKYVKKSDVAKVNKEKLVEDAKAQLSKYMEDQRLGSKEKLKKFVIVFLGFEDYILKEI